MSDPFLTAALVGTSRAADREPLTGTPVDDLVSGLGSMERERALLLRAGALSIYREAGMLPLRLDAPLPEPAMNEKQPSCSPGATALISLLVGGQTHWHTVLLEELLQRLMQAGSRVSPEVLPAIFQARPQVTMRPMWRRVIGARGRWLAQFNSAWQWATEAAVVGDALPPDAETIWHEGAQSQRSDILTRLRRADPARAREWIAAVWKQERAEMRYDIIQVLAINLSPDDEALLERALDDRTSRVRETAASVLAFLPHSAFVHRMIARADTLLAWQDGTWMTERAPSFVDDWKRDGLTEDAPRGTSKTDWYLQQILTYVPLAHWQMRAVGVAPADLVAATDTSPYAKAIIEGWSRAAVIGGDTAWLAALWGWWTQPGRLNRNALTADLLARLPQPEAEARAQLAMSDPTAPNHDHWAELVKALPRPWSATFGQAYLAALRAYVAMLHASDKPEALDANWAATFEQAALALPPDCFAEARCDLTLPDTIQASNNRWMANHWEEQWRHFGEIVALRQRILAEVPVG